MLKQVQHDTSFSVKYFIPRNDMEFLLQFFVMRFVKFRNIFLILIIGLFCGAVGYKLGTTELKVKLAASKIPNLEIINKIPSDKKAADFSLFWKVWEELSLKYVDKSKLDSQKMVYGAISGMVAALGDPYTLFLAPVQNQNSKEDLNGSFEGIGAQLGTKENKTVVIAPLANSPAEKAGIKAGDWILKVDGNDISSLSLPEVVSKIRGPKGTPVTVSVLHPNGDKPVDVTIIRQVIILSSVEWSKEKNTVHLRLMRFGDQTQPQWDNAVNEINQYIATSSGKVTGVILDVRNNPGGYLTESVYIASEFLSSGVVVKQKNYRDEVLTYSVNRLGKLLTVPLVVLINQGSASASEILAGALQGAGRAKLVGAKSFGKGSVQEVSDLTSGAGLHITTAKWLLSNDVWINGTGLTPDVKIDNDEKDLTKDLQLEKAVEILSKKFIL